MNPLIGVHQRMAAIHHRVMGPLGGTFSQAVRVESRERTDVSFGDVLNDVSQPPIPSGPVTGVPYAQLFNDAGRRHGVSPHVLAAVSWVESRFQPDAVSPQGARGLMQFMDATAEQWGVDVTDPASSIDGAARLLAFLTDRYGNLDQALAAYNVGMGTVETNGPLGGADRYVNAVFDRMEQHR